MNGLNHQRAGGFGNIQTKKMQWTSVPGGGLYNDYAVLALYDGAQLLLAVLVVILGGGLAVQLSLFWYLGANLATPSVPFLDGRRVVARKKPLLST